MPIPSYFTDFLADIRPTYNQRQDLIKGHTTLRNRLMADETLKPYIVTTFLQGSYRRSTSNRPLGDKRSDVDIIVVTNIDRTKYTPQQALDLFEPFVKKHYPDKYEIQGRSIGIKMNYVELDIVITSAPSAVEQEFLKSESVTTNMLLEDLFDWRLVRSWVEPANRSTPRAAQLLEAAKKETEWKLAPLWIPNREAQRWEQTHPLEQIRWTAEKNKLTNGHYVNVVKAIKWWRTLRLTDLKYPKGYPVEHMIGDCCPDGIESVAEGITLTLEKIVSKYSFNRVFKTTPTLPDRGVPNHDVWQRISGKEFSSFYDHVKEAATIARKALDAETVQDKVENWRKLFGDKFPPAPAANNNSSAKGGFSERTAVSGVGGGRFA